MFPQQIETHFCTSPIPEDLFNSPKASTEYEADVNVSSEMTEATNLAQQQYNNQIHGVQHVNYIMEPPNIELPPWMMDDIQLDSQPLTSIQSSMKMIKKYTFYVEVGDIL